MQIVGFPMGRLICKDNPNRYVSEERRMEEILPSGNVAVGLVFNYFVGFLQHVLPSK